MKMMDINEQDDCYIDGVTPTKKKKMKQAQLPFQMQSPKQSQNSVQSKKRKLTSPSVNCPNPKAIKISKMNKNHDIANKLKDDANNSLEESNKSKEVVDDIEIVDVKENKISNKVESTSKNRTPKRSSTGQKRSETMDKVKSSPLSQFLKKTDKDEENLKGNQQNFIQNQEDESILKRKKAEHLVTNSSSSCQNNEQNTEQRTKTSSPKPYENLKVKLPSESDVTISLDNKGKEQQIKSINNVKKSKKIGSPKILEALKLEKVKHSDSDMSSDNEDKDEQTKSTENTKKSTKPSFQENKILKLELTKLPSPRTDSDIVILSSDKEDKEEHTKSKENTKQNIKVHSPTILKTPKVDKVKQKRVTPKQQEKKLLSAQKKAEREQQKLEKEKRLEEERQNRQKEKEERRREKEEKEKAEKEQKLMERKMKDLKKQMEMEQKQKEKQAKEEERKKREDEKKKKEEEKMEAERKKQKAASNFTSFFVAKKQEKSVEEESATEGKNFMPFEVKADMKLAPVCRRTLSEQEKLSLDEQCNKENIQMSDLYLNEIKNKKVIPRKSPKTWPFEAKDDEVILLDDENDGNSNIVKQNIVIEKQRTKLLQFSENRRPPYWGTWRKRSCSINPRKPFSRDTKWFNYEVDSDEEWEEEEPGESLHGSDEERDEENPDDNEYDVDNEFMVPHGYLSDEELRADEEEKVDMSPETQKYKLKVLGEQFETERNTKTSKLKPKIIGCVWRGPENTFLGNVPQRTMDFLSAHEAWARQVPVTLPTSTENEAAENGLSTQQQAASSSKKTKIPEEALPELIRLIHGNTHGSKFLAREFVSYWSTQNEENKMSKYGVYRKIRKIGKWMLCPEEGPMHKKFCWYVPEDIQNEYLGEKLSLPNRWSYTLAPTRKSDVIEVVEKTEKEEKKNVPLITQFTKKITQEEMKKQLTVKPDRTTPTNRISQGKTPKRATLISVGRGEQFSKSSKKSLLKNFINSEKSVNKDSQKGEDDASDGDCIVIEDGSENVQAEDQGVSERDESDVKMESKGRLGTVPTENGSDKKEQSSTIKGNDGTLKNNTDPEDVVTAMDVDDPIEEN
ncbi:chromatin assembly factor 1 subunit A-B-like [Hylaeus anthracinus]|uniref:chromatin assembly factor 1 subunit A-B-like n=1 Tax=Hylaeus anthracinus TaxID=313031 RepID=UPI0023BA29D7|nr:chromatin assembly factor 1 subunit A-B-like [Hylaeus anthracinus]